MNKKIHSRSVLNEYLTPFKKTVPSDLVEIKKSLQFASNGFDTQKEAINKLLNEIKSLRDQNKKLEQRVQGMEERINFTEKQEKEKIEYTWNSRTDRETKKIVKKVLSAMKAEVNEDGILETYYVSKRKMYL